MSRSSPLGAEALKSPLIVEYEDADGNTVRVELDPDNAMAGSVPPIPTSARQIWKGRLFSLKHNSKGGASQQRQEGFTNWNDYELKYPPDPLGAETFPDARVWRTMMDKTSLFDMDKVEAWRDSLDVLLVFIGLFSAIVTTFVVQTSQSLQPDYAQVTALLVFELVTSQRASSTPIANPFPPLESLTTKFSPSAHDSWVNALWFTSLTISLSTALLAVLTKQWLYHYMSLTTGSARDRCRIRHFRYEGLTKWGVPTIIDLLPVALHTSLALFLAGLVLFIFPLHTATAAMVCGIASTCYICYLLSTILPFVFPQCPYTSPLTLYCHTIVEHIRASLPIANFHLRLCLHKAYNRFSIPLRRTPARTPVPLSDIENDAIKRQQDQIDVDALCWLYGTTANVTVHSIVMQSIGGLSPSTANYAAVTSIVAEDLEGAAMNYFRYAENAMLLREGFEDTFERFLRTGFIIGRRVIPVHRNLDVPGFSTLLRAVSGLVGDWWDPKSSSETFMSAFYAALVSNDVFSIAVWKAALLKLGLMGEEPFRYPSQIVAMLDHLLPFLDENLYVLQPARNTPLESLITLRGALAFNPSLRRTARITLCSMLYVIDHSCADGRDLTLLLRAVFNWKIASIPANQWSVQTSSIVECLVDISRSRTSVYRHTQKPHFIRSREGLVYLHMDVAFDRSRTSWHTLKELAVWLDPTREIQRLLLRHLATSSASVPQDYDLRESGCDEVEGRSGYSEFRAALRVKLSDTEDSGLATLREADALILLLGPSNEVYSWTAYNWLHTLAYRVSSGTFPRGEESSDAGLAYLHLPDNLYFLCRGAIRSDHLRRKEMEGWWRTRLFTNILAEIDPHNPNWILCVRKLTLLFDDSEFIMELAVTVDNPLHTISQILRALKQRLKVDLSAPEFEVPIYDETDNLVPSDMADPLWPEPDSVILPVISVPADSRGWKHRMRSLLPWRATAGDVEGGEAFEMNYGAGAR